MPVPSWLKPAPKPSDLPKRKMDGFVPFGKNPQAPQKPANYCKMSVVINERVNYGSNLRSQNSDFYRSAEGQKALTLQVKVSSPFAEETRAFAVIKGGDSGQGKPNGMRKEYKSSAIAEASAVKNIQFENVTPLELSKKVKKLKMDIEADGSCTIKGRRVLPNVIIRTHNIIINSVKVK